MEKSKNQSLTLVGGVLFTLAAIVQMYHVSLCIRGHATPLFVGIGLLCYAALAFCVFAKKRNTIFIAAVVALAAVQVYFFLKGFTSGAYIGEVWHYRADNEYTFHVMFMLPAFATVVGYLLAAAISVVMLTPRFPQYKDTAKKLFFVPSICLVGAFVLAFMAYVVSDIGLIDGYWMAKSNWFSTINFLKGLLTAAGLLCAFLWICYPDGLPKKAPAVPNQSGTAPMGTAPVGAAPMGTAPANFAPEAEAYIVLTKHILLLLFTFGIWNLIWVYRTTIFLNRVQGEEYRNPTTKVLLCMFVPFYSIYWTYKSAQRIDRLARMKRVESDLSTICLILAIFVAFVPPILMQDKLNKIVTTPMPTAGTPAPQWTAPSASPMPTAPAAVDVTSELKKYKELLDTGVITVDEFEVKKQQLLKL